MMNERESSACPHCSETIVKGASLCRFCQRGLDPAQFSPCTSCREMIRMGATICRFCSNRVEVAFDGSRIDSPFSVLPDFANPPSSLPSPSPSADMKEAQKEPGNKDVHREGGIPKFNLPQFGKLFKPSKDVPHPQPDAPRPGKFGAGVREQVLEVIVRQALAGAPWREICAGPMHVNNITAQEVEDEVRRRMALAQDFEEGDVNTVDHNMVKCEKLIKRLLRIADDIGSGHTQRSAVSDDIRELVKQLNKAIAAIKEQADNNALTNAILQNEVDMYGTKYDALLDLVNARDKVIEALRKRLQDIDESKGTGTSPMQVSEQEINANEENVEESSNDKPNTLIDKEDEEDQPS